MRDLVKSVNSFGWAMSLFGFRQLTNVLSRQGQQQATEAFNSLAEGAISQCGEGLRETFKVGDKMQKSLVDVSFDVLREVNIDQVTRVASRLTPGGRTSGTPV